MRELFKAGLEGHNITATLKLYIIGLFSIAPIALFIYKFYDSLFVFKMTPILVLVYAVFIYCLCYTRIFNYLICSQHTAYSFLYIWFHRVYKYIINDTDTEDDLSVLIPGTTIAVSDDYFNSSLFLIETKDILFQLYHKDILQLDSKLLATAFKLRKKKTIICLVDDLDLSKKTVKWEEMSFKEFDLFITENDSKTYACIGYVDDKMLFMHNTQLVRTMWEIERIAGTRNSTLPNK